MNNYKGLNSFEAQQLLKKTGYNILPEKKTNFLKKIIHWLISPISLMLLATAFFTLSLHKITDFCIIIFLFALNFVISYWHERKADQSIKKLQKHLTVKVSVWRDNQWKIIDSILLVPRDIVKLRVGSLVPADITILEEKNLSINESVLTGESFPKQKNINDPAYSGSFIATGWAIGRVVATGKNTYFGETINSIEKTERQSSLEKDILSISKFISIISIVVIILLTFVLIKSHNSFTSILTLDLSLLIAGIPIALPTVMSLIISIGVSRLSKKNVIVRRLASLEDLANVNLLLSDKTGTLTENKIQIEKVITFNGYTKEEVIKLSLGATSDPINNSIDKAIKQKSQELDVNITPYEQLDFTLSDSERKRSSAILLIDNKKITVSLGASQIIKSLLKDDSVNQKLLTKILKSAADQGDKVLVLAVSQNEKEKDLTLAGILLLADKIRAGTLATINFMNRNGIAVKMITGDSFEISQKVASQLHLHGTMYRRAGLDDPANFAQAAGFSEVFPKDKYNLVKFARGTNVVAVTGDGINDLPAIKAADVGFAVSNAVEALKNSADIVLLSNGISVIKDSILEARKIFARLYNYSVYRISESFRIIITIAVIGLIYKAYPLTPVQLIILAFLNDIPIVALAFDRVQPSTKPAKINAKKRFTLSTLFGLAGTANSLIILYLATHILHLSWNQIQTLFFLKLTVSGHMLIYVAHTQKRWFRFLPSKQVIWTTLGTQIIATSFAFFGIFTPAISIGLIVFIWLWSFLWMQISELMKDLQHYLFTPSHQK